MGRQFYGRVALLAVAACVSGCAARHAVTRADVASHLNERLGVQTRESVGLGMELPEGVEPGDGLSMDEAVAVALWNNPDLAVRMAELGFARADLMTAGKLANPRVSGLVPVDPRQWQFALAVPVEGLWIRPERVAGAQIRSEAVAQHVVQAAVDLAGSVRLAYTESAAARGRVETLGLLVKLREERRHLLDLQVEVGDVSPLALDAADQEQRAARNAAQQGELEEARSGEGLAQLLGVPSLAELPLEALGALLPERLVPESDALLERAVATRPDLRAAELNVEASAHEVASARASALAASVGLQVQGGGTSNNGLGVTPGLTVPLFDRNQDGVARALAQQEAAAAQLRAQRARVEGEVVRARTELVDAWARLEQVRDHGVPAQQAFYQQIALAYEAGDLSGVDEIDARIRLASVALAETDAQSAVVRARIQLERVVGGAVIGPHVDSSASLHEGNR